MMTNISAPVATLSDHELLARLQGAVQCERQATAHLIALLMEVDARRLYLGEGFSSLFTYCTHALHLSEHSAYNRIETARAARRFPVILDMVESGALTLTAIRLLAPHLTDANHRGVLVRAAHMRKSQVHLLVARINPAPDVPSIVRKLPTSAPSKQLTVAELPTPAVCEPAMPPEIVPPAAPRPAEVKPLAPERYKIQVTVTREARENLRRAQDLLRHSIPNGDPSLIIERALGALVEQLERAKAAATPRPRASSVTKNGSRYIPAAVKRSVWQRDAGRCAFNGRHGRCSETGFLEYHHIVPFASGGETSVSNLELRCRAHNQYEADLWFGAATVPMAREERARFGAGSSSFLERVQSALEFTSTCARSSAG